MQTGPVSYSQDIKPKLYHAMESDEDTNPGKKIDKGKGIDRELHPNYDRNRGIDMVAGESYGDNKGLNKGQNIVKPNALPDPPVPVEPPMVT